MLTLIGGKYTTHRSLAQRVVDRVARLTGTRAGRCLTAETPVPGRAEAIANLGVKHPGDANGITEAEVAHAVQSERARHLSDVLERRSRLWLEGDAMRAAAEPVSRWMAASLGWSEETRAREVERVTAALDRERDLLQGRSS